MYTGLTRSLRLVCFALELHCYISSQTDMLCTTLIIDRLPPILTRQRLHRRMAFLSISAQQVFVPTLISMLQLFLIL